MTILYIILGFITYVLLTLFSIHEWKKENEQPTVRDLFHDLIPILIIGWMYALFLLVCKIFKPLEKPFNSFLDKKL